MRRQGGLSQRENTLESVLEEKGSASGTGEKGDDGREFAGDTFNGRAATGGRKLAARISELEIYRKDEKFLERDLH